MFYDYEKAVKADIKDYIEENVNLEDYENREELEEYLDCALWDEDSVTGNGSGSYTFNSMKAGENLVGNFALLKEALTAFDESLAAIEKGEEFCDVTIRCYLLSSCLCQVLDEMYQ